VACQIYLYEKIVGKILIIKLSSDFMREY